MRLRANSTQVLNSRSASLDPSATLDVLKAPIPMTKSDPVIPAHREWEDLAALNQRAITKQLQTLKNRCATTRDTLDNTLTTLEISKHMFLGKSTPTSSAEIAEYLDTFTKAQIAGRAIFTPQDAYRSAVTTLSLLVIDLADMLPEKNVVKDRVVSQVKMGMKKAEQDEESARTMLRGLADHMSQGRERHALVAYLENVRLRIKNWGVVEANLKNWARECLKELH